jgi:tryptophan halogenase
MSAPIRTIAVVGDGIAAWTAAAALAVRLPGVRVAMVPHAARHRAMVDTIGATTPAALPFHADVGWDWRDALARAGGAIRLGTQVSGRDDYVHAYGAVGHAAGGRPFPMVWAAQGTQPFHHYAAGARLGLAGKAPSRDPALAEAIFGLVLDPDRYARAVEGYARHRGVMVPAAPLANVAHGDRGVTALHLADGTHLTADLYVDSTGRERLLAPPGEEAAWDDWSRWFPYSALTTATAPADPALPSLDRMTIADDAITVTTHLPDRTIHLGLARAGAADADTLAPGRRQRGWTGNVVAVGEAHVVLPPVQGLAFHWLHTGIDRIVALLPGRDVAAVEVDHYNCTANEEADRLRDLLLAQLPLADDAPDTLHDTVADFARRLRWRQRDGEGFARDDWAQILFGRGIRPAHLPQGGDAEQERHLLDAIDRRLTAAVAAAPDHRMFLEGLTR